MSAPLTADEAIDLLHKSPGAYATPDQLRTLAARVNADASGRLTVLYSGGVSNGVVSGDVIKAMVAAGEDVRVINKTQAAAFMESKDFIGAVAKAYDIPFRPLESGTYRGPATDWLYHPTNGPWADASARFAEATKGEVFAIVSKAGADRVFAMTELPRVIANPEVTTVEGIPRITLQKVVTQQGPQPAFEMVVARAHERVGTLKVAVNAAGMPLSEDGRPLLDSRTYLAESPVRGKTPATTNITRYVADTAGPPTGAAKAGQAHLHTWATQIAQDAGVEVLHPSTRVPSSNLVRGAGALGTAALAYDAYSTTRDTARLLNEGNVTGAQSQVLHFGGRTAGGVVAGFAAGAAYGAATGSWTGPAAVGTGVLGGVLGAIAGDKVMDAVDQSRIYSQRGSDGNHWSLDPQHPDQGWSRLPRPGEFGPQGPPAGAGYSNHLMHATPRLADELNYKASSTAVELALAHPPAPQDPFRQAPESIGETVRPGIGASQPWARDPQSHAWTRQATEAPTPMTHGMPVQRTVAASAEQGRQLDAAAQRVMADNIAHSPQGIAQRYLEAYGQHGWKQHGPVPAAVTHAGPGQVPEERNATRQQMPAQPQPAGGHLTPQQIERITPHESRVVPTPGGMSLAEAHKRRDEPEQISAGSLQPAGKLDASHLEKGSPLSRTHQAQEQDLMRGLGMALAQDRERFKNEPAPGRQQPLVERTQERTQAQAPRRLLDETPVQKQAETRQAAPSVPAVHPTATQGEHVAAPMAHTPSPAHANPAPPVAPVHHPQGAAFEQRAATPLPSQPMAQPAAAALAAAQAELAEMRERVARMEEQRRQEGLERRDERDQREATQGAQSRDTRQHLDAGSLGRQPANVASHTSGPSTLDRLSAFSDPSHPHNAMYSKLKELLPEGTSEKRLAQSTSACYLSGIDEKNLRGIDINDARAVFAGDTFMRSGIAVVDISQPPPTVQQSEQQVQRYDQQQAQMMSEIRAQNAAQANQQLGATLGAL